MNRPSFAEIERSLEEIRRQLSEQDAEWLEARRGIESLGDIQLAVRELPDFSLREGEARPGFGLRG